MRSVGELRCAGDPGFDGEQYCPECKPGKHRDEQLDDCGPDRVAQTLPEIVAPSREVKRPLPGPPLEKNHG